MAIPRFSVSFLVLFASSRVHPVAESDPDWQWFVALETQASKPLKPALRTRGGDTARNFTKRPFIGCGNGSAGKLRAALRAALKHGGGLRLPRIDDKNPRSVEIAPVAGDHR
jgi:hypothetical protein